MSSRPDPFGDSLLCPICFETYAGRILQCSQGHAVCEKCHGQLTECPQCRCVYMGTRNYVLEAVMEKLKSLTFKQDDVAPVVQTTTVEKPTVLAEAIVIGPPRNIFQPAGLIACRINACGLSLPAARLINHLHAYHSNNFFVADELKTVGEIFTKDWMMTYASTAEAIQIKGVGVFFFIMHIDQGTPPVCHAWVQSVTTNESARNYRFSVELTHGRSIATFTDYTHGIQSDLNYIMEKRRCLIYTPTSKMPNVEIVVKIWYHRGNQSAPRQNTTYNLSRPQTVSTTSSSRQANNQQASVIANQPRNLVNNQRPQTVTANQPIRTTSALGQQGQERAEQLRVAREILALRRTQEAAQPLRAAVQPLRTTAQPLRAAAQPLRAAAQPLRATTQPLQTSNNYLFQSPETAMVLNMLDTMDINDLLSVMSDSFHTEEMEPARNPNPNPNPNRSKRNRRRNNRNH